MSTVSNRFNEVQNLVDGLKPNNVEEATSKRESLGEEKVAGEKQLNSLGQEVQQLSGDKEKLNEAVEKLEEKKANLSWYNVFKKKGINEEIKTKQGEIEGKDTAIASTRGAMEVQTDHNAGFSALQMQIDANIERVAPASQRKMGNRPADWSAKQGEMDGEVRHISRALAENPANAAELLAQVDGLKEKSSALATVMANETQSDQAVVQDMQAKLEAFQPYVGEKDDAAGTAAERQMVQRTGEVLSALASEIKKQQEIEGQVRDIDPASALLKLHGEIAQEATGAEGSRRMGQTLESWQGKLSGLDSEAASVATAVLESLEITPETEAKMADLSGQATRLASEAGAEANKDTETAAGYHNAILSLAGEASADSVLSELADNAMSTLQTLKSEAAGQDTVSKEANNVNTLMDALRLRVDIESATMGAGLPAWSKKEEAVADGLKSSLEALQGVPTSGDLDTAKKAMQSAAALLKELNAEIAKDDATVALYESSLAKLTPPADDAIGKVVTSIKEKLAALQTERDGQQALGNGLTDLIRQVIPAELAATNSDYAASGKRAGELSELTDEHARMKDVAGSFVDAANTFSGAREELLGAERDKSSIQQSLGQTQQEVQDLDRSLRRLSSEADNLDGDVRRARATMEHHVALKVGILGQIEQADRRFDSAKDSLQDARRDADATQNDYNDAVQSRDSAISNKAQAEKQRPVLQAKLKGYVAAEQAASKQRDAAQDALKEAVKAMAASKKAGTTVTVKSGENLTVIAGRFPGVSVDDIVRENGIADKNLIKVGQKLKIPGAEDKVAYAKAKGAKVKAEAALKKAAAAIADNQEKKSQATQSLKDAARAISQAEPTIRDAESRMSSAESKLRTLRSQIDRRERDANNAEADLDQLQDQSKLIIASANDAEQTYEQFSRELNQLNGEVRRTREELDGAQRRERQQSDSLEKAVSTIDEAQRDLRSAVDSVGTLVDAMNDAIQDFNDQPSTEGLVEVRRVSGFDNYFEDGQVTRAFERALDDADFAGFGDFAQALQATVTSMRQTIDSEIRKENASRSAAETARFQELMA